MNGYGSHTFKWYNHDGEIFWVKYHFKTDQGIQNLTREEAERMKGPTLTTPHATSATLSRTANFLLGPYKYK